MDLRSPRLIIRPWRRGDDALADSWPPYNDPLEPLWNLTRHADAQAIYGGGFDFGGVRMTWAVENYRGDLMGRISLREVDQRLGRSRLGITFGAPFVSRGYGTEAMVLFLDHYFGPLGFTTMVLDVAAPNERAVRSYQSLGFRYIGDDWRNANYFFDRRTLDQPHYHHLHEFFRTQGHIMQVRFYEMELTKEDWQAHRDHLS